MEWLDTPTGSPILLGLTIALALHQTTLSRCCLPARQEAVLPLVLTNVYKVSMVSQGGCRLVS